MLRSGLGFGTKVQGEAVQGSSSRGREVYVTPRATRPWPLSSKGPQRSVLISPLRASPLAPPTLRSPLPAERCLLLATTLPSSLQWRLQLVAADRQPRQEDGTAPNPVGLSSPVSPTWVTRCLGTGVPFGQTVASPVSGGSNASHLPSTTWGP